jgi:hypothetical protein
LDEKGKQLKEQVQKVSEDQINNEQAKSLVDKKEKS